MYCDPVGRNIWSSERRLEHVWNLFATVNVGEDQKHQRHRKDQETTILTIDSLLSKSIKTIIDLPFVNQTNRSTICKFIRFTIFVISHMALFHAWAGETDNSGRFVKKLF